MISIIAMILQLYLAIVIICALLRSAHADFHNTIVQVLVKLTKPILSPLHRIIPDIAGIDVGGFVGAFLVRVVTLIILLIFSGIHLNLMAILFLGISGVLSMTIDIWFYAIIIQSIMSWFRPSNTTIVHIFERLTEPLLAPARRLIPRISGIDLSPIPVLIALQLINYFFVHAIAVMGMHFL